MAFLIAAAALFTLGNSSDEWETITPEQGGFSVKIPANSTLTRKKVNGEDGSSEVVIVQAGEARLAYLVTYVDVSATTARMPRSLLDGTRDVAVSSSKGKLLSEKKILLKKYPGREIRAEVPLGDDPKGGFLKCRIYLVGRRVFQVMAIGPKDEANAKEIDKFFGSFQIISSK